MVVTARKGLGLRKIQKSRGFIHPFFYDIH
jgi:hypothetical protein